MKKLIWAIFLLNFCFTFISIAQDEAPQLVLPIGHTAPVTSVAFTPDMKYIVSGSFDSTTKLWEISTGKEVRTFPPFVHPVMSVKVTSDGKYIISASYEGIVKIWDIYSGKEIKQLYHKGGILSIALSPDNKCILTAAFDKTLKLWEISSGQELKTFSGHTGWVYSVAFDPSGIYAASGSGDKTIRLWNISTGREAKTFPLFGNRSPVRASAFSPDGRYVLAGFNDKILKLWSVATGQEAKTFSGYTGAVYSVAFSSDGRIVAAGCGDNTLKLWEVSSGKQICSFGHEKKVNTVVFSPDGKYILSGSDDNTIKLWDFHSGQEILTFKGYTCAVRSNVFSPDGRYVVSVSGGYIGSNIYGNNEFAMWDINNGRKIRSFSGHKDQVMSVDFSPDGHYIASCSLDKSIKLWDVSTGQEIHSFSGRPYGHKNAVYSVRFSPGGKYILSCSEDKTIKLWDVKSKQYIRTFAGHKKSVYSIAYSPDGLYAMSGSFDETMRLWDISNGKEIKSIYCPKSAFFSIDFSPDGRYIVAGLGGAGGFTKIWDVDTGQELSQSGHNGRTTSVQFSSDGKYVLSAGLHDKIAKLWEASNGKDVRIFSGHQSYANSATFSPDGKYVLTGSSDGTTRLWETDTGKPVYTRIQLDKDDWIVTTPDGRFDGSPEGIKLLHYAKDNKSIPLDSLFDRFYTPNLVAQVMSGEEIPNIPDIRQGIQMPPLVRITSPEEGQTLKEKDIKVIVEATDQGGGIEDIRLYHNDKRISGNERGMKKTSDKIQSKFTVTLVNGINTLRATAFSKDRTESRPYEVKIKVEIGEATSDMYIVAVGINSYKNSNYNLNYCVPDAQAMISTLSEKGKAIFRNIRLQTVFDEQATLAGIESALKRVEQDARPEDVFVFYYSGHGVMNEDNADFYFVPNDVTEIYGNGVLEDKGLSATHLRDISQRIKATKQLLIIDSCQSGKMIETFTMRGISEEKAIAQLARSAGITVIAATQSEQFALEFKEIKHGLFTYVLLQGMEGKADGSPKDNRITVSELSGYVQATIPELTQKYRGKPQYPNVYMRGQDFPIVMKK